MVIWLLYLQKSCGAVISSRPSAIIDSRLLFWHDSAMMYGPWSSSPQKYLGWFACKPWEDSVAISYLAMTLTDSYSGDSASKWKPKHCTGRVSATAVTPGCCESINFCKVTARTCWCFGLPSCDFTDQCRASCLVCTKFPWQSWHSNRQFVKCEWS